MANLELVLLLALVSFFPEGQSSVLEVRINDINGHVQAIASRADDMICFFNNRKAENKETADALQFIATKAEDVLNRAKDVTSMIHSLATMMNGQKQIQSRAAADTHLSTLTGAAADSFFHDWLNSRREKETMEEKVDKLMKLTEDLVAQRKNDNLASRADMLVEPVKIQTKKGSDNNVELTNHINGLDDATNFSQENQTLYKLEELFEVVNKKLQRVPEEQLPFLLLPNGVQNKKISPDWFTSLKESRTWKAFAILQNREVASIVNSQLSFSVLLPDCLTKGTLKYAVGDLQLLLPPQVIGESVPPKMCNVEPSATALETTNPNTSEPRCESGWDRLCSGYFCHCYKLGAVSLNWVEARNYCQSHSAELASIHSSAEQKFLKGYLSPKLGAWVGLSKGGTKEPFTWSDKTQVKFTKWYPMKPSRGSCTIMDHTLWSDWNDIDCQYRSRNIALICKKAATQQTPDDSLPTPQETSDGPLSTPMKKYGQSCQEGWDELCTDFACNCYQLGPDWMEWEGARGFCIGRYSNLASIESAEEQKLLEHYLTSKLGVRMTKVWIGLNRVRPGRDFYWSDGSQLNYLSSKIKGIGNCGVMDRNYAFDWGVNDCRHQDLKTAVLCKKAATLQIPDDPAEAPLPTSLIAHSKRCQEGWDQLCTTSACFCYQLGPVGMEWEGARNFCKSQTADLALMESTEEHKLLQQYMDAKLGVRISAVWIALTSYFYYPNWETSTTGNCAVMDRFDMGVIDCYYKGFNIAGLCKKKV